MADSTERDQQIAQEDGVTLIKMSEGILVKADAGHEIFLSNNILAAIQDAKQQGNETWKDLAVRARIELELLEAHWSLIVRQFRYPQSLEYRAKSRDAVCQEIYDCQKADAARGVQPAAKEVTLCIGQEGDKLIVTAPTAEVAAAKEGWWSCAVHGKTEEQCGCGASTVYVTNRLTHPPSEDTKGHCIGTRANNGCGYVGGVSGGTCPRCGGMLLSQRSMRKAERSASNAARNLSAAAQQESTPAAEQWDVEEVATGCWLRHNGKRLIFDRKGVMNQIAGYREVARLANRAPLPTQNKPASVEQAIDILRGQDNAGKGRQLSELSRRVEQALNVLTASSLAETLTPQEQESQETGVFRCKSGQHIWTHASDAEKCCNGWKRVLVWNGGDNQQNIEGVLFGRKWIRDPAAQQESAPAAEQVKERD